MALRNVYLAAFLLLPFMMMAQDTDTAFRKEWIAIDTLIVKNDLTRTALEKVNALQLRARQNRLPGQVIKALIYRYTLEDRITTNDPAHSINSIRTEITASKDETQTAILHALLAKQYRKYYNNHRYLLYSRKNTQGLVKDDLTTWGNDDFIAAISHSFLRSLAGARILQQTNIQAYDAVILKGNQRNLRPTLFDLLAHEALDYFMSGDAYLAKPSYAFTINDPRALSTMDTFIRADFSTKDSSSQQWQALNLFRQLLAFHRNDPNPDAVLDVDLKRIQWVYQQALFPGKETAYVETLQSIIDRYPAVATASQAWHLLAAKETEKARSYAPFGDTSGRYGYVKARQLIEKALPLFTENSLGKANMQNLLTEIHTKQLSIQTERVNIPYKPFRALVAFRNTDTLFMRIIQISNNDSIRTNSGDPDYWQKISRLTPFRSITQPLPVNNDQQLHSTEIKIESLPVGEYALFCSSGGKFSATENKMCIQFLYVSGISYVKNRNDYFVLNRESGKPMADVKVTVLKQQYISRLRKFIDDTVSTKTTNQNGYFRFEANNGGTFHYLFTTGTDRLNLRDNDYSYADNTEPEETEAVSNQFEKNSNRVFFFTDRSIYRPGQSVFFKGIAVTRDYKTKLSRIITAKDSSWIYLRDVNGKTVDSLKIGLNSYGSFSGKFQLPQNVLTGNFSIEARRYNRSAAFISVEEYKRPKFTVQFEKVTGAYRLNDTIVITGTAKAYAGNAIDGAKVSYNVTRNTRYMIPWYWRRPIPQGVARQIDHGEVVTDAEGKFTIRFKALAEDIADRSGNPLFDFSVQADVTDAGGETHSTTAHVSAGFTSLLLQVNTAPVNATDSTQKIGILTTNLANEKQPAKVQVKIFALQSPGRLVRKRYWNRPDQFVMTEKEFIRTFPTDEYREESNYLSWETGKPVLEGNIDTKTQDTFAIAPGILQPGYYKIEAITTDQYGVEVKQVGYLQLFDQKNNKLPVPAYKFNYTITNTAEPGQTASFLAGSSAGDVFVISKTERPRQKASGYNFEYRSAGLKKISFTPEETDRGGINLNEVYVYDNRIYTTQYTVAVPWTNKSLQVSYASYRDKAEPGSAENWTVTVQGSKGEQTAAELLTGMYDASLDQFKAHNWSIPPVWETNPVNSIFTGYTNFAASNYAMENYLPEKYTEQPAIEYDQLASEGWQLWTRDLKAWSSQTNFPLSPSLKEAIAGLDQSAMMDAASTASMTGGVRDGSIQIRGTAPMAQNQAMRKTDLSVEAGLFKETRNDATSQVPAITPAMGPDVVIRKNFNETAFFFPQLYADSTGKYSFSFTLPEALTQWKWMTLAHTKDLAFGSNSTTIVTQKKLMVQTNAPRFLREGDNMEFSSKIVNLSGQEITGQVTLELVDATTNTSVDGWFQNVFPAQYFTVAAGQSSAVKFPIQIPFSFNRPLTWRVIAKTAEFSDGEENSLPVLTNRTLVTESLPLFLQNDTTRHLRFEKLLNTTSETLTHESITVEYTSNPVWYAVQALPYLMEYPYECAEQTFNRLYANTLASYIVNRHPRIKQVLDQWRSDTSALKSNLQKNEALKQLLLEETPWVIQAENEAQQKKNLALLFDLVKLSSQADASLEKLRQAQLPNGSFSWFRGGNEDRYITNYILTGIGKLKRLGALTPDLALRMRTVLVNAIKYMDGKIAEDYDWLVRNKADLSKQQISSSHIDYLYMRSFFADIAQQSPVAYNYFYGQGKQYWIKQNSYYKAQLGLVYFRNKEEKFATSTILPALLENVSTDTKQGMYWKSAYAGFWHQSPIEHQSMMIAFMAEINRDGSNTTLTRNVNAMRTWLLLNKQTNNWRTTIATADACYALLLNGTDWLNTDKKVSIQLGKYFTGTDTEKTEAGTGYFKKRIEGKLVDPAMGNITVTTSTVSSPNSKASQSPSWGSVYWQYFEDLDKITPAASPLSLSKKLFIERNTDKGKVLDLVKEGDELKTGDRIVVRMELRSDRDMDYLHLKDMRAASMEPVNVLSGYKWQDGLGYYESTRDASTNFFISHLAKGTYVFEYPLFITHTGIFSAGIATIQCMYAPEFTSHSEGVRIRVEK